MGAYKKLGFAAVLSGLQYDYDNAGRMTSKSQAGHSATYSYRYGSKLHAVTSGFPDEADVTYETGGDGKRRSRTQGTDETWYNWDAGWNVISEEDDADGSTGSLVRSYYNGLGKTLAQFNGSNPGSPAARHYFTHDHLRSTRALYDDSKGLSADFAYTPYGRIYHASNADATTHLYTGHTWDQSTATYFAPYRYYAPHLARWLTRDPIGMVDGPNVYAYVLGNPIALIDPLGQSGVARLLLCSWLPCDDGDPDAPVNNCLGNVVDRIDDGLSAIANLPGIFGTASEAAEGAVPVA